jgi:hypothetical protein
MSDFKVGQIVYIKPNFWWYGKDLGGYSGEVKDITGYVLVYIWGISEKLNPVKCFRYDLEEKKEAIEIEKTSDFFDEGD